MTDTNGELTDLIDPDADTIYEKLNYAGLGNQADILFGPECEFFICKNDGGRIVPISRGEADEFKAFFEREAGATLHQEAIASHFELNYGPMNLSDFREKFEDYSASVRNLYRLADEKGYRVVPSSHAPHIEGADDVIDQLVDRERIRLIIPAIRDYMGDSLVKFANLTAGIHISSGYKDPDQFYTDLRRTYYLSPFIYALSNNGFPFWQGMKDAEGIIPRLAVIEAFAKEPPPGGRTGVDPLFYEAANGEDFLHRYIDRLIHTPVLCFRKARRTLTEMFSGNTQPALRNVSELGAGPENPITFADLGDNKLNTIANLQFAASSWWYGVKVQDLPLKGENDMPLKRFEDRVWNAGTWQLPTALLVRALMTQEPECGSEVDTLLNRYGFHPGGPALHPQSGENLKQATETAWRNGRDGLDFRYGNGTALDFGREFTAILKKYAARHGLKSYLEPMDYITSTNETDARVLARICKTPEDVAAFISSYDVDAVSNPQYCFGMLRDEGKLEEPSPAYKANPGPGHRPGPAQPQSG